MALDLSLEDVYDVTINARFWFADEYEYDMSLRRITFYILDNENKAFFRRYDMRQARMLEPRGLTACTGITEHTSDANAEIILRTFCEDMLDKMFKDIRDNPVYGGTDGKPTNTIWYGQLKNAATTFGLVDAHYITAEKKAKEEEE